MYFVLIWQIQFGQLRGLFHVMLFHGHNILDVLWGFLQCCMDNIACVFPVGGIDKVIDDIYSDPSIFTRLSCPIPATSDLCLCTWRHPRGRHGWKWVHPFFISSSSRTYYICELRLSMTYWLNRNVKTLKSVQLILQLRAPRYMWFWTVIWYIYTSGPI